MFRAAWAGRGLFASDPRVQALRRALVSVPGLRHIRPDRISLEGDVDPRVVDGLVRRLEGEAWLVQAVEVR